MKTKSHKKGILCKQNGIMHVSSYQQFFVVQKNNKLNNKVQVSVIAAGIAESGKRVLNIWSRFPGVITRCCTLFTSNCHSLVSILGNIIIPHMFL